MSPGSQFFCESYREARQRFRDAAKRIDASLSTHSIDEAQDLTIDVATLGPSDAKQAIVISSGVHGVEGFMGSTIQLAWLSERDLRESADVRFVWIHALNPYGFHYHRRCNEDNVDLNRNFHAAESDYRGAPARYRQFNHLLNPATPAGRFDFFKFRATCNVIRYGMSAMKEAVVSGQYDYPKGIFFGGHGPCASNSIVQENIEPWIGGAQNVVHVDLHSGLGEYADYRLLLVQSADDAECDWYRATFEASRVEPLASGGAAGYVAAGAMGSWLRHRFRDRIYRFVTAEFGTYDPVRVIAALRNENRVHFYNQPTDPAYQSAKRQLLECFCPQDTRWRTRVIESGVAVIDQAVKGLPC